MGMAASRRMLAVDGHMDYLKFLSVTKVADFLVAAAMSMFIIGQAIDYSYLSENNFLSLFSYCLRACFLALISMKAILFTKYSTSQLVWVLVVSTVSLMSFYTSGSWHLITTGAIIVGAVGVDNKKLCGVCFATTSICVVTIMALALLGVIKNWVYAASAASESFFGVSQRSALGFLHVNYAGMFFVTMLLCRIVVTGASFSKAETISWFACAAFLFLVINTKTASIVIIAVVVVQSLVKFIQAKSHICILCIIAAFVIAVLGCWLPMIYSPSTPALYLLNNVMSNRLAYAHNFLSDYPITLFGQNLGLVSTLEARELGVKALVLDNAYINLLLRYGAVSFSIILFLFFVQGVHSVKSKDVGRAFAITTLFVVGLSETWLFMLPGSIVLMGVFASKGANGDVSEGGCSDLKVGALR